MMVVRGKFGIRRWQKVQVWSRGAKLNSAWGAKLNSVSVNVME